MKAKQFLCKLFVSIFAICMLTGICVLKPAQTAVAATVTTTNVSASMKMTYEGNGDSTYSDGSKYNWWQISLKFDGFALPKGATASYYVNDHATDYTALDLMSYIVIDEVTPTETDKDSAYFGKTAREIVNANANNALNKAYGGPAIDRMVGVYGPISVHFTSSVIRIRGCTEFVAKENLKLTFLGGFEYSISDTQKYTWSGITYAWQNDKFSEVVSEIDVTDQVKMNFASDNGKIVQVDLSFDGVDNVLPVGVTSEYWVNDNATKGGNVDLMQYIKFGNSTARAIVASNTIYSGLIGNLGGQYAPVGALVSYNGVIYLKALTAYCKYENLSITLMSGLKWTSTTETGKVNYVISKDVTFSYDNGYFMNNEAAKTDVSDKVNLTIHSDAHTQIATPAGDGTYTSVSMTFGGVANVMHKNSTSTGGFWVNDNATNHSGGVDLMKYIYINGKSARSIVSSNSVYSGLVLASKGFGPVAVCVWPTSIEIRVRNDYVNYSDLFITLKGGLGWFVQDGTFLKTTSDQTFCVKENSTLFENVETALAEDSFDMMKGASVRTSEYAGIRFSALYNAEELDYWMNNKGCTVEVGMLLTKSAQLAAGEELTFNTTNKVVLLCTNNGTVRADGTYRFNGGVSPVKDVSSYTQEYVGRAYVKITVGELVFYKYATVNDNVRTIAFVAQEALNDTASGLTETEKTFLQKIVNGEAVA